jgi:hypothetical protein
MTSGFAFAKRTLASVMLLCGVGTVVAAGQPASDQLPAAPAHRVRKAQPKASLVPAMAEPRPVPAPSAIVAYQDGLLTITAQNATLREIMDRVRESTGAVVEVPALDERVTVQLGPQPPAIVLVALLEGSPVNYVIVGGAGDANAIRAIQVTPKPVAGPDPAPSPAVAEAEAAAEAARARALFIAQTGGDEGVWDNEPPPPAATAPAPPPSVPPAHE